MQPPYLPPELEERIFTEAAELGPRRTLYNLLLVARRVHEWLEPLLYSYLSLKHSSSPYKISLLSQKSSSYLSSNVVSILLASDSALDVTKWNNYFQLLERTIGVQDLTLIGLTLIDDIFPMMASYPRLQSLTLDNDAAFAFKTFLRANPEFIFPTLTHLDCTDLGFPTPDIVKFQLPALTHFVVDYATYFVSLVSKILREVVRVQRAVLKYKDREVFEYELKMHEKSWMEHDLKKMVFILVQEETTESLWRKKASKEVSLWQLAEQEAGHRI
ncbi:hypothetical protein DL96DRAFT_1621591 [Flagelloscypha sp. PMI_526]|nr:hypothetical protein DL96DRAFT_1621591 [Flagelloscypha sp. PMI_526]